MTTGNYLGLTIETVSRQMSGFKKDGLITCDGKRDIVVPELEALGWFLRIQPRASAIAVSVVA